jgi:hypothetical protein
MPTIESKIDELYQEPLEAFTSSRNALAKTLSGADAKRVKTLAKPTLVPWAINQLYWNARLAWDRLLKSGEQLRKAQLAALEGTRADVRAASDAHRRAVGDAVKAAVRLASAAGSRPPADALMRALEAVSLMSELPAPAGRLTEAPRPAGFEALAGAHVRIKPDTTVRLPASASAKKPDQEKAPPRSDPRKEAEARKREAAAARQHEGEVRKAEAALDRAKAAATSAREGLERAEAAVAAAEKRLSGIKSHGKGSG